MFDSSPVSPGHSLIIPKNHRVFLNELATREWSELGNMNNKVVNLIEETDCKKVYENMLATSESPIVKRFLLKAINHPKINTKPDAYNFGVNDGRAAGRTVDHFHWHVIPRYTGDMDDPRGGVRHVIPEMGNYKK